MQPPRPRGRVLLIANPGSRRGAPLLDSALSAFRSLGVRCDAMRTEGEGHAAALAREYASRYEVVFTLGGDGTAMEVVGALASTGRLIGVLPGGTGNLIARALAIPLDVPSAVRALLDGHEAWIDLGRLEGGRRFAFAAGVGIDSRMVERTPAVLKRRLGIVAYLLSAANAVLSGDAFQARITVDGVVHERVAAMVMVTNFGAIFDELITLGPGISQDDGLLDLCVFSPGSLRDAVRIAWRLFRKDFRADPCILYAPGQVFVIETSPPRRAQADGELLGMTPFRVSVEPRAARLLVPTRD
ncbi:MAG TPA: diacylglycerol kinase family protein [Gemmatimonadaceae bacterium]|nr:diacylglycerol kinase family protein [Gemmatimonadaceae bacterium]